MVSMFKTVEDFKKQDAYWCDDYYHYAIHITNGGAVYLFQIDGPLTDDTVKNNVSVIRLDGSNLKLLIKNIKETVEVK